MDSKLNQKDFGNDNTAIAPKKLGEYQLQHQQLTSLINSMSDGVLALDQEGRVVLYNGAALNILDVNGSINNKHFSRLTTLINKEKQLIDVNELIRNITKPAIYRDFRLLYPDNSLINLSINISPVNMGYGRGGQAGFVVILRDITHEKSLEEERDEFISVVSHELRTPIAVAEGNISNAQVTLQKSGSTEDIKQALLIAHDQIIFLGDMINDLSTLSRAEQGKLSVQTEDINVIELLQTMQKTYEPKANSKGLSFNIDVHPQLELLHSCKLYVKEILQNFITNAIKYTEKGSITIGARAKQGGVELFVTDTGIGIARSEQKKIFDKFFRSEDYRTRKSKGTGLGLYVTMKLVQLIQAKLEISSELDEGSTFKVFVPNLTSSLLNTGDERIN